MRDYDLAGFLLMHEPKIRLGFFVGIVLIMMVTEIIAPKRPLKIKRIQRWPANIAIAALGAFLVRALLPLPAIGIAVIAAEKGWGVFNILSVPTWIAFVASVILLDFAIYIQHVLFHVVPVFWRLHRMHHADLEFDVTTGSRFHPLEIVISMAIKIGIVLILGAPAIAVLVFEILLNATSMFNHGNIALPVFFDRWLRLFIVTPDMHRIHHSILVRETNSNFGFNLPWWDRLFGTYRKMPEAGHEGMTIGLEKFRDPKELGLVRLITQPFR